MAFSRCFCTWFDLTHIRHHRLGIFVVLGSMFGTLTAFVHADTVTFRFDAMIDTVFPGIPFDSGIGFAEGDTVTGEFTFEPHVGDGSTSIVVPQASSFSLDINGVGVAAPSFEISSFNDGFIDDFPVMSPIDILQAGAGNLSPNDIVSFPNIDPSVSSFRMSLFGPENVLSQASVPETVSVWNRFDLWKSLDVTFRNGTGGAIGFHATVNRFAVVPEPSSLTLLLIFTILATRP